MIFTEIINNFLSDQDITDLSRKVYRQWLRPFQKWVINNDINIQSLRRADVIDYKKSLTGNYSDKTVNCYLTAIRMLYRWMEENEIAENTPSGVKLIRLNKPYRKHALPLEKVGDLIVTCPDTNIGKRVKAIIMLMTNNGLRAVEISRIKRNDITNNSIIIQGKGHHTKDHRMELTEELHQLIIGQISNPQSQYIFHSKDGRQLRPAYISHMVNAVITKAGLKSTNISAHSLRHTAAVSVMLKTNDIVEVKKLMRHSSVKTTEIYLNSITSDETKTNSIIQDIWKDLTQAIKTSQNKQININNN